MQLARFGPDGLYAARQAPDEEFRFLQSDPFATRPGGWELGRSAGRGETGLLAPVKPGKVVGIGRSYEDHAEELGNPVPEEPLLFLKSPSAVIGPRAPVVLPPESERVEFEGEIAVVLREGLRRADATTARAAILGVTAACDVTARDLQSADPCFSRAKSFDTFCPLGPVIAVDPDLEALEVTTRLNGEVRQHGTSEEMLFGVVDLLVYLSRYMTLAAGDVVLTGTPSGVGPLADGDRLEIEVTGAGVLQNEVQEYRQ